MSRPGTGMRGARPAALSFTGLVLATAAIVVLFRLFPEIDLWFQRLFWDETQGFFLKNSAFATVFYKGIRWATPVVVVLLCVVLLLGFVRTSEATIRARKPALVLLACIAIGSGLIVNTLLKDQWGRARPSQITEFGGVMQFTPPFAIAEQCERNCSFVAGHPSLVFAFFGLALFAGRRRGLALAAVTVGGAMAGLGRVIQGGHFLSDVIFSGVVMFIVSWVLYRLVLPLRLDGAMPRAGAPPGARKAGGEIAVFLRELFAIARAKPVSATPSHLEAMGTRLLTLVSLATVVACALGILWIDRPLALALKANAGGLAGLAEAIAAFGSSTMWLVAAGVMGIALWLASRRVDTEDAAERYREASQRALFFLVAVGGAGLTVNLLKFVFGRTRPRLLFSEDAYAFQFFGTNADVWSFPSGHTVTAAAVAAAIYFLWPRLVAPFAVLAVLVGLARVVQTVHYLSDVLFSIYLALIFTLSTKVWFERRGFLIFAHDGTAGDRLVSEPAE
ncbi:MAG TPA: phosphatase PAP2 family protein [Alphaproteobacteria bacterium]|nr:phosphatase PAP2 family protein [Alphaproteobacteria bacterium]